MRSIRYGSGILVILLALMFSLSSFADHKKGYQLFTQGDYQGAIKEFRASLEISPDFWYAQFMIGRCYKKMGSFNQAIAELKKAEAIARDNSQKFTTGYEFADIYYLQKNYREAINSLNRVKGFAAKANEKGALSKLLGMCYINLNNFEQAAKVLEEAARHLPQDYDVLSSLGKCYVKLDDTDAIIRALGKAVKLRPNDVESIVFLGRAYLTKGDFANAVKIGEQGERVAPRNTKIRFILGNAYLGEKNYEDAIRSFRAVLATEPRNGNAMKLLGESYKMVEDFGPAVDFLLQAASFLPDDPEIFDSLGFIYEKNKRYEDALKAYEQAYRLNPALQYKASIDRINERLKGAEETPPPPPSSPPL